MKYFEAMAAKYSSRFRMEPNSLLGPEGTGRNLTLYHLSSVTGFRFTVVVLSSFYMVLLKLKIMKTMAIFSVRTCH